MGTQILALCVLSKRQQNLNGQNTPSFWWVAMGKFCLHSMGMGIQKSAWCVLSSAVQLWPKPTWRFLKKQTDLWWFVLAPVAAAPMMCHPPTHTYFMAMAAAKDLGLWDQISNSWVYPHVPQMGTQESTWWTIHTCECFSHGYSLAFQSIFSLPDCREISVVQVDLELFTAVLAIVNKAMCVLSTRKGWKPCCSCTWLTLGLTSGGLYLLL